MSRHITRDERAYVELQSREWAGGDDVPTRSHHQFTGVPYHQLLGAAYGSARLGRGFDEKLGAAKVV